MSLFPIFDVPQAGEEELPVCREPAWDFENDRVLFAQGRPVIAERSEAVRVWCCRCLRVPRFRHAIYSAAYGSQVEELIGRSYSEDARRSEVERYVREALECSPYVADVREIAVEFAGSTVHVSAAVKTIYGDKISVRT